MKEKRCVAPAKSLDTPHTRPAQASLTLRPAGSLSRPQATFVTRLQPMRLPARAARQLPDQSKTLRVDSSSTDVSRLRGALPLADVRRCSNIRCRKLDYSGVLRADLCNTM